MPQKLTWPPTAQVICEAICQLILALNQPLRQINMTIQPTSTFDNTRLSYPDSLHMLHTYTVKYKP